MLQYKYKNICVPAHIFNFLFEKITIDYAAVNL